MMVFGGYTGILFPGVREFFLHLEEEREREILEEIQNTCLRAFLNLRFANESAGNEQRLRLNKFIEKRGKTKKKRRKRKKKKKERNGKIDNRFGKFLDRKTRLLAF